MSHWPSRIATIIIVISIGDSLTRANEYLTVDDNVLCEGFSPAVYHQRIQQYASRQQAQYAESQQVSACEAEAEQRSLERIKSARRVRFEKEARRREDVIAQRKAQNATQNPVKSASKKAADKSLFAN